MARNTLAIGLVHPADLHEVIGEGRSPSETTMRIRRDRIHRSVGAIERPPVAQRRHHDTRIDVVGNPRHAFEVATVVEDADRIAFTDIAPLGIRRGDEHELLALTFDLVRLVRITRVEESVAFG